MSVNIDALFQHLMEDPDIIPPEGEDKEDIAMSMARQRAKQSNNNTKALSMAKEDRTISKLLAFLVKADEGDEDSPLTPAQMNLYARHIDKINTLTARLQSGLELTPTMQRDWDAAEKFSEDIARPAKLPGIHDVIDEHNAAMVDVAGEGAGEQPGEEDDDTATPEEAPTPKEGFEAGQAGQTEAEKAARAKMSTGERRAAALKRAAELAEADTSDADAVKEAVKERISAGDIEEEKEDTQAPFHPAKFGGTAIQQQGYHQVMEAAAKFSPEEMSTDDFLDAVLDWNNRSVGSKGDPDHPLYDGLPGNNKHEYSHHDGGPDGNINPDKVIAMIRQYNSAKEKQAKEAAKVEGEPIVTPTPSGSKSLQEWSGKPTSKQDQYQEDMDALLGKFKNAYSKPGSSTKGSGRKKTVRDTNPDAARELDEVRDAWDATGLEAKRESGDIDDSEYYEGLDKFIREHKPTHDKHYKDRKNHIGGKGGTIPTAPAPETKLPDADAQDAIIARIKELEGQLPGEGVDVDAVVEETANKISSGTGTARKKSKKVKALTDFAEEAVNQMNEGEDDPIVSTPPTEDEIDDKIATDAVTAVRDGDQPKESLDSAESLIGEENLGEIAEAHGLSESKTPMWASARKYLRDAGIDPDGEGLGHIQNIADAREHVKTHQAEVAQSESGETPEGATGLDDFGEQHLQDWLDRVVGEKGSYHEAQRDAVETGLRRMIEEHPEIMERGDSYPEIRRMAERNNFIPEIEDSADAPKEKASLEERVADATRKAGEEVERAKTDLATATENKAAAEAAVKAEEEDTGVDWDDLSEEQEDNVADNGGIETADGFVDAPAKIQEQHGYTPTATDTPLDQEDDIFAQARAAAEGAGEEEYDAKADYNASKEEGDPPYEQYEATGKADAAHDWGKDTGWGSDVDVDGAHFSPTGEQHKSMGYAHEVREYARKHQTEDNPLVNDLGEPHDDIYDHHGLDDKEPVTLQHVKDYMESKGTTLPNADWEDAEIAEVKPTEETPEEAPTPEPEPESTEGAIEELPADTTEGIEETDAEPVGEPAPKPARKTRQRKPKPEVAVPPSDDTPPPTLPDVDDDGEGEGIPDIDKKKQFLLENKMTPDHLASLSEEDIDKEFKSAHKKISDKAMANNLNGVPDKEDLLQDMAEAHGKKGDETYMEKLRKDHKYTSVQDLVKEHKAVEKEKAANEFEHKRNDANSSALNMDALPEEGTDKLHAMDRARDIAKKLDDSNRAVQEGGKPLLDINSMKHLKNLLNDAIDKGDLSPDEYEGIAREATEKGENFLNDDHKATIAADNEKQRAHHEEFLDHAEGMSEDALQRRGHGLDHSKAHEQHHYEENEDGTVGERTGVSHSQRKDDGSVEHVGGPDTPDSVDGAVKDMEAQHPPKLLGLDKNGALEQQEHFDLMKKAAAGTLAEGDFDKFKALEANNPDLADPKYKGQVLGAVRQQLSGEGGGDKMSAMGIDGEEAQKEAAESSCRPPAGAVHPGADKGWNPDTHRWNDKERLKELQGSLGSGEASYHPEGLHAGTDNAHLDQDKDGNVQGVMVTPTGVHKVNPSTGMQTGAVSQADVLGHHLKEHPGGKVDKDTLHSMGMNHSEIHTSEGQSSALGRAFRETPGMQIVGKFGRMLQRNKESEEGQPNASASARQRARRNKPGSPIKDTLAKIKSYTKEGLKDAAEELPAVLGGDIARKTDRYQDKQVRQAVKKVRVQESAASKLSDRVNRVLGEKE